MNPLPTGQPPLDSTGPLVGVEIGGTKLQVVVGDGPTRITGRWRAPADRAGGAAAVRRQVEAGVRALLAAAAGPSAGRPPRAVGVGFGGPVDVAAGRARRSHQVGGWDDFPLGDWLAALTGGAPVAVENDANAAALAEAVHGAGRESAGARVAADAGPVFYANFGSGVGGGLVVGGGSLYRGRPGGEVEFGHLRLDRGGTTVEDRCAGWAVDRRVRAAAAAAPGSDLARRVGPVRGDGTAGGEARHLAAAVAAGDGGAARLLGEVAADVAFAVSHVVHLFNPRVVVLGGGLSRVGEPLRAAVAAALPAFVMAAFRPVPPVRLAGLGEDAVPVGALELAGRLVAR